ncbi:formate dehydrogenase beta subunit [Dongia sp.]|uniref:formate dehydrogenase beta subunit n=1 Tax=Dongia sp. TaxID=1977262 RepID=UPI0035B089C3
MTTIYIPCDSAAIACGAEEVLRALEIEALTQKLDLKIVRNGSRGLLWLEPMVEVQTPQGRIAYGPVTPEDVPALVKAGFLDGSSAHPLYLGKPEEIPYLKNQERVTFARCGIIDPTDIEDYIAHEGYRGLKNAVRMSSDEIITAVTESGLRGRGGAGFPTGIKWKTVQGCAADQKYIVCNADEGDSGTFADRMIMEGDPFLLIEGMTIAGLAVGATKGFVYIRSEYPLAYQQMEKAIVAANRKGYLGPDVMGSGKAFQLELRLGAGAYICGEETSLLESLEGKRGTVRAKPPLPAIKGLFGKPTVINNVLSFVAVPTVLDKGATFYKDFGMGRSRGTKPFQLAGNVKHGGLIEKAFGITIRQLVEDFGGGTASGRPIRAVQVGGPLGAYFPASLLDTPMDYEAMAAAKGMLGHGGIVVFDDTVDMGAQARFAMEFCAIESCGKCTPCRIGSTRGVEVIDRIRAGENRQKNMELLADLCDTMLDGSLCALGGLTPFPVQSAIRHFPEDFNRSPLGSTARAAAE